MSKPEGSKEAGGWTTRRDPDGVLLYVGTYKVGEKEEDKEKPIWIDKSRAIRLAHTVLEAVCRFWDIEVYPEYVRNNTKILAENVGLEVKEPYREGCPFCQHVSDSEDDMRKHLEEEHEIHLTFIEAKEATASLQDMTAPPELSPKQEKFLTAYLDQLDYRAIDTKKLLKELITTQVLRDPDASKGGKYDIFCGHNRTLAYTLMKAETTMKSDSSEGVLKIFHIDEEE